MLSSLNWSIDLSISHSRFPVFIWINILNVINSMLCRHSARRVDESWLVERLWLIKPVSVLSSDNIGVNVRISFPRGFVEKLGICLETTSFCAFSISLFHGVIKFTISNRKFEMSVWLRSKVRFQISFSKSGAPLFENCLMFVIFSSVSVTSELNRSSFVESLLINFEVNTLPFVTGVSKVTFFVQASSRDFGEWSSKFGITCSAIYETGIPRYSISFQSLRLFDSHIIWTGSIHMIISPCSSCSYFLINRWSSMTPFGFGQCWIIQTKIIWWFKCLWHFSTFLF